MKPDKETLTKLQDFRTAVATKGEEVVFKIFPNKILELQELIDSTNSTSSPFHLSHASTADIRVHPPPASYEEDEEAQSKKRKRTANGAVTDTERAADHVRYPNVVHSNQHTTKIHDTVKRQCEQCAELIDQVKLWVNLTMPKIEDGDNFGVQVQEEVFAELQRAQESVYNLRDSARQDHLNRAKICSKLIKYPHVEDYVLALREHDEKNLYFARQHLFDLRNMYAVLTDIIHKNISKIRVPKANNSVGLY